MADLIFKTKLKEVPVTIDDKKYFVRELNGEQREQNNYANELNVEFVDGKPKVTTKDGFKVHSDYEFLSKCLYDENNVLVEIDVLKKWPTSVLTKLHKLALSLSGLDTGAEAEAKNDLKASGISGTD